MGGIASMPKGASFPATSDLDVGILIKTTVTPGHEVFDECYRGVAIEAGLRNVELYGSAELVLANPDLASNLAVDSIIVDPDGLLARIQPVVASEYGRRRWVRARCEWEKKLALASMQRASQASTPAEFLPEMVLALVYLSGLIVVASVKPPTHRKCLVLLRELLQAEGRNDLYEQVLAISGVAHLGASEVMAYQQRTATAFDRAVEVHRTPVPFDFKLKSHLRPYFVDGTQVMIDEGNHREAMPWICMGLLLSTAAIRNDAPEVEGVQYVQIMGECFNELGIAPPASWLERLRLAAEVKDSLFTLADEIVGRLSDDIPLTAATT